MAPPATPASPTRTVPVPVPVPVRDSHHLAQTRLLLPPQPWATRAPQGDKHGGTGLTPTPGFQSLVPLTTVQTGRAQTVDHRPRGSRRDQKIFVGRLCVLIRTRALRVFGLPSAPSPSLSRMVFASGGPGMRPGTCTPSLSHRKSGAGPLTETCRPFTAPEPYDPHTCVLSCGTWPTSCAVWL